MHAYIETCMHTDIPTYRQTYSNTDNQGDIHTHIPTDMPTHITTYRHTYIQPHTQTDTR